METHSWHPTRRTRDWLVWVWYGRFFHWRILSTRIRAAPFHNPGLLAMLAVLYEIIVIVLALPDRKFQYYAANHRYSFVLQDSQQHITTCELLYFMQLQTTCSRTSIECKKGSRPRGFKRPIKSHEYSWASTFGTSSRYSSTDWLIFIVWYRNLLKHGQSRPFSWRDFGATLGSSHPAPRPDRQG